MAKEFIHLHVHSHYSIYKGLGRIRNLVNKAINDGMPGMALTDLGNMFGIREFHDWVCYKNKKRIENGEEPFKPILGCEMCVEPNYHIIVLAKNLQGYKNLIKLVSDSWIYGYDEKPCTSRSGLKHYHEGLIVLSGSLSGEVPSKLMKDNISGAREAIEWYHSIFGDDYYIELQRHEVKDVAVIANRDIYRKQVKANDLLLGLAKEYGIKVVCTNNVHFVEQEQAEAHDRWLCIGTKKALDDPERIRYSKQEWFKTRDEMSAIFNDVPEALTNTIDILDKVEIYSIDREQILPLFPTPEGFDSESDYLKELTLVGASRIYGNPLPLEVEERLLSEFEDIESKGFSRYFLIIQDLINVMRNDYGVMVGPGRASVAGSLVCYCLGITQIDPLKYDLLFERFVNLNRNILPDIDIDFDEEGQFLAEKYLEDKYGKESCAHIVTFDKMDPKTTMKSVAKLENVPNVVNALFKAVPNDYPHWRYKMEKLCLDIPEFQEAETSKEPALSNTIKYSKILDGTVSKTGIHACGLIVSPGNIGDWVPVCIVNDPEKKGVGIVCTQYDGWYVEETGLVKFDLLKLKALTELKNTLNLIKQTHGIEVNLNNIPIDDPKTFELFQEGDVEGVFEFDSIGKGINLYKLHPTVFSDLVALYTFYLPGYEEFLPSFIARKNGREEIKYDIPSMERYLKETYGFTIYQEQIMHLSRLLANFTPEESDILRKALGKKKQVVIDEMKPKFMEGGVKNGYNPKDLEKVWADWEKFGPYAYCKSHAVCYTWLAYQTAYLKAHYPDEYMSAYYEHSQE
jgi:DNA polymerase-3 subunit alpha